MNGFYRRRRGILEHLEAGTISLFDAGVHDYLCLNAQARVGTGSAIPPGVWFGSAKKIWLLTGRQDTPKKIQRSLAKLDRIGWIRRFRLGGKHGDYPILISRLLVTDAARSDFVVDALNSTDWKQPKLVPTHVLGTEASLSRHRTVHEPSAFLQDLENKRNGDKPVAAAQPGDRRLRSFFDFATEAYSAKHGEVPTWNGKELKNLAELLKRAPAVTSDELQRRFTFFLESTDAFIVRNGFGLSIFCMRFDALRDGPISQQGGTNGSARNGNGKNSAGAVRPEPGRTKPAAAVFSNNGNTLTQ